MKANAGIDGALSPRGLPRVGAWKRMVTTWVSALLAPLTGGNTIF